MAGRALREWVEASVAQRPKSQVGKRVMRVMWLGNSPGYCRGDSDPRGRHAAPAPVQVFIPPSLLGRQHGHLEGPLTLNLPSLSIHDLRGPLATIVDGALSWCQVLTCWEWIHHISSQPSSKNKEWE